MFAGIKMSIFFFLVLLHHSEPYVQCEARINKSYMSINVSITPALTLKKDISSNVINIVSDLTHN